MDQTIDALINADKDTELGDIFYLTLNDRPYGIIFSDGIPGVRRKLLDA